MRSELPEIPSGLATLTDRALPSLFPVEDQPTFDSATRALVLEQPPPQGSGSSTATTFAPLADLGRKGYFSPGVQKRLVVLVTDGESVPFDANDVADGLHGASLVVLRVGNAGERVYRPDGHPEAYRPHQTTALGTLVSATGGRVFGEGSTDAAVAAARAALGDGPTAVRGRTRKTTPLAPYIALAAALALLVLLRRRKFPDRKIALANSRA